MLKTTVSSRIVNETTSEELQTSAGAKVEIVTDDNDESAILPVINSTTPISAAIDETTTEEIKEEIETTTENIEELETTTEAADKEEIKTTQGNTLIECKNDSKYLFKNLLSF